MLIIKTCHENYYKQLEVMFICLLVRIFLSNNVYVPDESFPNYDLELAETMISFFWLFITDELLYLHFYIGILAEGKNVYYKMEDRKFVSVLCQTKVILTHQTVVVVI